MFLKDFLERLKIDREIAKENSQKHQNRNNERNDAKIRLLDLT